MKVFQYGSNCDVERLNWKNKLEGNADVIGKARTIDDYELVFNIYSTGNSCAAANLIPGKGRQIWGVLYEIPEDWIIKEKSRNHMYLDRIEGGNYKQKKIQVQLNGIEITALTYLGINQDCIREQTNLDYVSHILTGLLKQDVCSEYIQYVKTQILKNNPNLKEGIRSF